MKRILVIILIVVLVILFIRILSQEDDWICVDNDWIKHGVPSAQKPTKPCGTIDSFEECAAANNPVMESYPRQCRDAEGNLFIEMIYTEISGIVSLKGELFCTCFLVNDVDVWYDSMEGKPAVDVSNINNGDFVVVKGEFKENRQFWAIEISKEQLVECKPEDREVDACIEIYQPVCGRPINQTFSNSCFACMDENVDYYMGGECPNE